MRRTARFLIDDVSLVASSEFPLAPPPAATSPGGVEVSLLTEEVER